MKLQPNLLEHHPQHPRFLQVTVQAQVSPLKKKFKVFHQWTKHWN